MFAEVGVGGGWHVRRSVRCVPVENTGMRDVRKNRACRGIKKRFGTRWGSGAPTALVSLAILNPARAGLTSDASTMLGSLHDFLAIYGARNW